MTPVTWVPRLKRPRALTCELLHIDSYKVGAYRCRCRYGSALSKRPFAIHWFVMSHDSQTKRVDIRSLSHSSVTAAIDPNTRACTLDFASVLSDGNDRDVPDVSSYSHFPTVVFVSLLARFFPLGFMYLGCYGVPWHYGFICRHRPMQFCLFIPPKVPITLCPPMTTNNSAVKGISAAVICLASWLSSNLSG